MRLGETDTPESVKGSRVRFTDFVTEPNDADIAAVVWEVTAEAETVNVDEVLPAGIVTDAGTATDGTALRSDTAAPPLEAGPLSVTVPVEVPMPAIVAGLSVRPVRIGAVTVRLAVADEPFADAVIVAEVADETVAV